MKKHALIVAALALVAVAPLTTGTVEAAKPKAVQVFILAGQSNMVGHANFITIPTLFTAKEPEVRALSKLAFKNGKPALLLADLLLVFFQKTCFLVS